MEFGFIGFGEAARHITKGLKQEVKPITIMAFDLIVNNSHLNSQIISDAEELSVTLESRLSDLILNSSIILSATTAKAAVSVAKESSKYLSKRHLYIDMNATSPDVKKEICSIIESTGAKFVDVAVMGSIPKYNHKVPILISGSGVEDFLKVGKKYHMDLEIVDYNPGSASSVKMARSIFMKGFASLLIETISSSYRLGVEKKVIKSLNESFDIQHFENMAAQLIVRTAIHSERRVSEMDEVLKTFKNIGSNLFMSEATKNMLKYISEHKFNSEDTEDYINIIRKLNY